MRLEIHTFVDLSKLKENQCSHSKFLFFSFSSLPSWASREDISIPSKNLEADNHRLKRSTNVNEDRSKKLTSSAEDRPILSSKKNFDELLAEHLGNNQQVKIRFDQIIK